jgi:hypothetical protein
MADVDPVALAADLARLRQARASGVLESEFSSANGVSRRVKFRSDAELAAAIADIEGRLAPATGQTPIRSIIVRNSSGW